MSVQYRQEPSSLELRPQTMSPGLWLRSCNLAETNDADLLCVRMRHYFQNTENTFTETLVLYRFSGF